jgi:hypothetical protein
VKKVRHHAAKPATAEAEPEETPTPTEEEAAE